MEQNISDVANKLPRMPKDAQFVCLKKRGASGTTFTCKVSRERVLRALVWLKVNNPVYAKIEIDYHSLSQLPSEEDDQEPTDLPVVELPNEPTIGDSEEYCTSFLPSSEHQPTGEKSIVEVLNWPEEIRKLSDFTTPSSTDHGVPVAFP